MRRQFSKYAALVSVGRTTRVVRVSNRTPRCASSSVITRLTTDSDTSSLRAAGGEAAGLHHRDEGFHGLQPIHVLCSADGDGASISGHAMRVSPVCTQRR